MLNDKLSLNAWLEQATAQGIPLSDFLAARSAEELDINVEALLAQMQEMLVVMQASAEHGLSGVRSRSGLSGGSACHLREEQNAKGYKNLLGPVVNDAVAFALAVSESNAAMGRIVAAPTAGAAGILPGVLLALKAHYALTEEQLAKALIVAGNIGLVIANRASLSGAVGGCQAECGSAAAMAAGAAVDALGGTPTQVGTAVAIVFKNMLGLVCDPVAGLVEVPCVKRNAGATVQALLAAELALAGISSFIPADEAIDAMKSVGDSMSCSLRETAGGGLACTPTALAWAEKYFAQES